MLQTNFSVMDLKVSLTLTRNNKYMKKISTKIYSLEVPEKWEIEYHEDDRVSLFNPNGKGAITISSYSFQNNSLDPIRLLENFVKGKEIIKVKETRSDYKIAESEYEDSSGADPMFVYAATICYENQLLLISYFCRKDIFSTNELDIIKKIITTFKFNI